MDQRLLALGVLSPETLRALSRDRNLEALATRAGALLSVTPPKLTPEEEAAAVQADVIKKLGQLNMSPKNNSEEV